MVATYLLLERAHPADPPFEKRGPLVVRALHTVSK